MMPAPTPYMLRALDLAKKAAKRGEVPVGAVLVESESGAIAAEYGNEMLTRGDPTAHAEMLAIRSACEKAGNMRLEGYDLYVTLEPCPMCAAAISFARLRRVYFGAYDPKGGGVEHGARIFHQPTCHHAPEVIGGLQESACAEALREFFKELR